MTFGIDQTLLIHRDVFNRLKMEISINSNVLDRLNCSEHKKNLTVTKTRESSWKKSEEAPIDIKM